MFLLIEKNRVLIKFTVIILIISSADSWTFDYDDQEPVLEPESLSDVNCYDTFPKTDQPGVSDLEVDHHSSLKTDPVFPSTSTNDQGMKGNQPIDYQKKATDYQEKPIDHQEKSTEYQKKPIDYEEKSMLPIFSSKEKIEEGRQRYEVMKSEAPKYGVCWSDAIQSLHVGCSRLNDDLQARMGLSFANCFLEKVGSRTYPCSVDSDVKSCVQSMDDRAFNTYTHFYTHTQSICFFLANQVWQESTSQVVYKLSDTSAKVSERLIHLQDLQEESISTQVDLNEKMSESKERLESFGESLREKQLIEKEILNRFMEVKEFILSELSKVYSLGFYLFSIITVYLITTPVRTNPARFWILLLFAANLAVERYIVSNILSPETTFTYNVRAIRDVSSEIDELTWICRKATCIISTLVIFVFWITYKDYGQLNHGLLSQVHHQQKDLIRSTSEIKSLQFLQLQRMGLSPVSDHHVCPLQSGRESDSQVCPSQSGQELNSHVCPLQGGQESDSDLYEAETGRNMDIMSDFSDLDSGHEEGPSDTDSATRIKFGLKKRKKGTDRETPMVTLDTMSNGQPVEKVRQKSNQVTIYSPTKSYKLRERKPRATTPLSNFRSKVVPKVEPVTPTKRLEFSDDD